VTVAPRQLRFVDTVSSLRAPPQVRVCGLADGSIERPLLPAGSDDPRVRALDLQPPELTTIDAGDGTELHCLVYRPGGDGPFPTVVSVYGGPHAQQVTDSWGPTASLRRQWLRSLGMLVVVIDNRGSAGRGLEFEGAIRWDLGTVEVEDQITAVRELAARGLVDPGRVAINGWSYGGYMSAMCLAKAPGVFKVAVAGAPVTAWDGYDTHYTERYMGLPSANPDGYERSKVMTYADGIRGRWLLLVHGLIDENVHFRHTARLANLLNKRRVPYDVLMFPEERHSPRAEPDRVYMEERIRDYLLAHL
jgi:dipeptidyl-peptidase-4